MRLVTAAFFLFLSMTTLFAQKKKHMTPFEKDNNTTATYSEAISFYKKMAKEHTRLQVNEFGMTDSGFPLHEVVLSQEEDFDPASIQEKGKTVLMINNAIHPGEPCGVDASMLLIRDYLELKKNRTFLKDLVIVVVPVYNIGGAINRNSTTRTNQNGPLSYGFRGNAKNLDLNRDFIKCDSRNARSFNQLFHKWMPDVFVDNHTSNGADYQYTMTLIATEDAKMDPALASYMNEKMLPRLYEDMATRDWEMTPYVYARDTPDKGIAAFLDLPRYSSGYAAMFDCISFMPETHMLKPYKDRVESTYAFMDSMIKLLNDDHKSLKETRQQAIKNTKRKNSFDVNWTLDKEQQSKLGFKGYQAEYKPSEISGEDRLYYDRNKPYTKEIPYLDTYKATKTLKRPMAYIIPQAYQEIIERLKWNGVKLLRLTEDFETKMELYRIKDFETVGQPYEGHYLHSKVELDTFQTEWPYYEGDYVVIVNQPANRYIVEMLEPQGPDSFFAWNFFDGILQQKEYFSPYVFEDLATAYLKENPALKEQLEAKKIADPEFAKNANAQLTFIYKNSPHYERTHRVYPIGRFVFDVRLPAE
ncbi:MAG: M14 family metallopeptidase [Saprospiraceae bacterium]